MPRGLSSRAPDFAAHFAGLLADKRETAADVDAAVADIIDSVRRRGDAALFDLTELHDRVRLTAKTLRIPKSEIDAAEHACSASAVQALDLAATRIGAYHRRLLPADLDYVDAEGIRLGARWRPIPAVGIYVPGGLAAYPSSVLMNAIPARIAGVERIAMAGPKPDGQISPP